MSETQQSIEAVRVSGLSQLILQARDKSCAALEEIAKLMRPGMTQKQGYEAAQTCLRRLGAKISWHIPYVLFGKNTALNYNATNLDDSVILKEEDIFSLDIGPVWGEIEGDVGATFTTSSDADHKRICDDVKTVFQKTATVWRDEKLTGMDLYVAAEDFAKNLGWEFSRSVNGHRISEFPHKLHTNARLAEVDFAPVSQIWVLEIHITDPQSRFGAFYEDVLM